MLGIAQYKSGLLSALKAAQAHVREEVVRTKEEWAEALKDPTLDPQVRMHLEHTDLDFIVKCATPYVEWITRAIRDAKSEDDLLRNVAGAAQESMAHTVLGAQDFDVHRHLGRYFEEFALRYEDYLLEGDHPVDSKSESIAHGLNRVAEYAKRTVSANAYASDFTYHLNPLNIAEEGDAIRPYSCATLATETFFRDFPVDTETRKNFVFSEAEAEEHHERTVDAFAELVIPYLPETRVLKRVGTELISLIGRAHDAAIDKRYGAEREGAPERGILLQDKTLIDEARQLLLPVLLKYPNMCDDYEQYLAAANLLEQQIAGKAESHVASIEGVRGNVVQLRSGGR